MGQMDDLRQWVLQNKLKAICEPLPHSLPALRGVRAAADWRALALALAPQRLRRPAAHRRPPPARAVGFWATGLSASLAWQWSRPIPTQVRRAAGARGGLAVPCPAARSTAALSAAARCTCVPVHSLRCS